jgi:hypothetical protein
MGFKGKAGGGFWNGVTGKLTGFEFTNVGPGDSGDKTDWVYLVPTFLADGADEDKATTQHLFLGGQDRYSISKDGQTIQSVNEDGSDAEVTTYGAKTPAGRFLDTMVEAGTELGIEALLPDLDAGEPINLGPLEGIRVRLAQEKDEAGTKKRGQRVAANGNKYDRTNSIVDAVYELPAGKGKAVNKSSGTRVIKGAKADVNAARDKADAVVVQLIADAIKADKKNKTGETPVSKFKMAALRSLAKDGDKDVVIKLLGDEAYRADAAERGVFVYDEAGETVASA